MIKLPNEIIEVMNLIKSNNYEVYIVGGYIRDKLIGVESFDVDMTTNATPLTLKEILGKYKLNEKYVDYGSVKFKINKYSFEITTFRKEFDYLDHRKPNKIQYAKSLKEDIVRRDFTINSICYDGEKIIDPIGGINDLNNKLIRVVGNANDRFKEDCLRILRALRFSSVLDFNVDAITKEAIKENYLLLKELHYSSLQKELKGILQGKSYIKILKEYKKELIEIYNLKDLKVKLFNNEMEYNEKEAMFYYFSEYTINNKYLLNRDMIFNNDSVDLKKKLMRYGYEKIFNVLYFKSRYLNECKLEFDLLRKIENNGECYNLRRLKIKGNDLIEVGIKNDKIGKCLDILLQAVIENKCVNDKENLLKYLKDREG